MLLMPLILWWAHRPLRFAAGSYRVAVIVTMLVVQCSSLLVDASAGDTGAPAGRSARHREGGKMVATPGRVIAVGRRWAFIPMQPKQRRDAAIGDSAAGLSEIGRSIHGRAATGKPTPLAGSNLPESLTSDASTSAQRLRSRGFGSQRSSDPSESLSQKSLERGPLSRGSVMDERPSRDDPDYAAFASGNRMRSAIPDSFVLLENLMLGRIVDSIRRDASDDNWVITGVFTEFQDANYLTIRSAKRTSKPLTAPLSGR